MIKSFIRLFVFSGFFGLLIAFSVYAQSFASPRVDESQQPAVVLYNNIKGFFGELRGTFRFYNSKLSLQIGAGLESNPLLGRQVIQFPKVGNDLYLVSGNTVRDFPLLSAVVITPSEKVFSAALLDGAGLTIFLRTSKEDNLYIAVFNKWANDLWCSRNHVYSGLGNSVKVSQTFDLVDCRPLHVQIFYLSGYGNKSVN